MSRRLNLRLMALLWLIRLSQPLPVIRIPAR